jgi:hypothetical protein
MRQRVSVSGQSALLNAGQLAVMFGMVPFLGNHGTLAVGVFLAASVLIIYARHSMQCPRCRWPAFRRKGTSNSWVHRYAWPPAKCPNCGISFDRPYRPIVSDCDLLSSRCYPDVTPPFGRSAVGTVAYLF